MTTRSQSYSLPTSLQPSDPSPTESIELQPTNFNPNPHAGGFGNTANLNINTDSRMGGSGLQRDGGGGRGSSGGRGRGRRGGRKWYKVKLFRGMINDVRRRAPFYWSDWVDAWDYRVVPATIYMYFAK